MTDQSTNLALSFLMPAQAQKHVTVNESLLRLDAIVQAVVQSRTTTAQPASPSDGQMWIVPPGKTGADWAGYANYALAYYRDGAWEPISPKPGWRVYVIDELAMVVFDGSVWSTILANPGEIGATTPAAATFTSLNGDALAGFRNRLMNGAFNVWRRGASFTAEGFCADRWSTDYNGTGGAFTCTREAFTAGQTDVPGEPEYFLRWGFTAAPTGQTWNQFIQAINDVRTFAGQQCTISFWAKTPDTSLTLDSVKLKQVFAGGSTNLATTVTMNSLAVTSSWTLFYGTVTLPSISGKTFNAGHHLLLQIRGELNAAKRMDIALVQLEPGPVATPFEWRPLGVEESMCKRYFERLNADEVSEFFGAGYAASATQGRFLVPYAAKRAIPAITLGNAANGFNVSYRASNANVDSTAAVDNIGLTACRAKMDFVASTLTTGDGLLLKSNSNDGYFDIDAEL